MNSKDLISEPVVISSGNYEDVGVEVKCQNATDIAIYTSYNCPNATDFHMRIVSEYDGLTYEMPIQFVSAGGISISSESYKFATGQNNISVPFELGNLMGNFRLQFKRTGNDVSIDKLFIIHKGAVS